MVSSKKFEQRKAFLDRYGGGVRSYFKREGAMLMTALTIFFMGLGTLAFPDVAYDTDSSIVLTSVALAVGFVGTFVTYHYKITRARKTVDVTPELETGYVHPFDSTFMDRSWNDAPIYIPPPTTPVPAVTRY